MVVGQVGADQFAAEDEVASLHPAETVEGDGAVMAAHAEDAVGVEGVVAGHRAVLRLVHLALGGQRVVPQPLRAVAVDVNVHGVVRRVAGETDLVARPARVREVVGTSPNLGVRA